MATTVWIKRMLDRRGIDFEELHHRVAFTAQEVAESEHVSGHRVAKVVVVLADGRPVELILPATRRIALDRLEELLGAKDVRLASEAEMHQLFTDCETGAIPPLRHWKDVEVIMDASMRSTGDFVFQAGTHEDVIRLRFQDWFGLVKPLVASFSEPESGGHGQDVDRADAGIQEWEALRRRWPRSRSGRAACREAARDGLTWWSSPASIPDPDRFRRETPRCARPPSSSTASSTSRGARWRGDPD